MFAIINFMKLMIIIIVTITIIVIKNHEIMNQY